MSQHNELYPVSEEQKDLGGVQNIWKGSMIEHRQPPGQVSEELKHGNLVRHWSDFNEQTYLPRSLNRLPDILDESSPGWNSSRDAFDRFDQDTQVVENSMRQFLEECDSLQGISITLDSILYGGFSVSLLEKFREEYPKHPIWCNVLHSDLLGVSGPLSTMDWIHLAGDSMAFLRLHELQCTICPLSMDRAKLFSKIAPLKTYDIENSEYLGTGLLSLLFESASLPSRLRNKEEFQSLSSLSSLLDWRGDNKICHLQGGFQLPLTSLSKLEQKPCDITYDISFSSYEVKNVDVYAAGIIVRGVNEKQKENVVSQWIAEHFKCPVSSRVLPLPSLPKNIKSLHEEERITLLSAITTSSSTVSPIKTLAERMETLARLRLKCDVDEDDLTELRQGLWTIHDGYAVEAQVKDVRGEDEE